MKNNNSYSISDENSVKRCKTTTSILFVKSFSSSPIYILGIYKPELVFELPWFLYMESFHHYHSRIFYLLAVYRSFLQMYVALYGNGVMQKKFIILECFFDISIVSLFLNEFSYNKCFSSQFFMIHLLFSLLSLLSLKKNKEIKIHHIV